MEQKILKQLELIEKSIKWVKETDSMKGAKGNKAYRNLVNLRRKANKKKYALGDNPAAAIFGQSQVGKSYLIDALLSDRGRLFNIAGPDGVIYSFKKDMNPQGGGSESTSLVSRFSVRYTPVNSGFPIKAKLLSPADLVLVLCDSYYNDVKASRETMLQREDIDAVVTELSGRWQGRPVQQAVFNEDDVLDVQEYVFENFSTKAGNVSAFFFEKVSLFIDKVRPDEWKEVFSLLWNKNEKFTKLFSSLVSEYQKLEFADTLYLPIEAVLYKHGTLLDVTRLKEIYEPPKKIETEYRDGTDALIIANGKEKIIKSFPKSYLCALSAELVFNVPETLLASKPFLKETDLLDFPGARARKTTPENNIAENGMSEFLTRGKVAYLFNKYSNFEKINVLIFCAKHEQPSERAMPEILDPLIRKIIGNTPESREDFIKKSKIAPLFIIGTFFNVNLERSPKDNADDVSSLNYRWWQRFDRSLAEELIDTKTYHWFENWTVTQPYFQNIFLLRDFEHSTQIFEGYSKTSPNETGKKEDPEDYPDFSGKLRESFINYGFVKNHFEDPENSWDRAASVNEDGTRLILDRLTVAADNINTARREKTVGELNEISLAVLAELNSHYDNADNSARLQKARFVAGIVQDKLNYAFRADGIKDYGQLMKELMLDESSVYRLYREKIDDIEHDDVVNMDIYSMYRMTTPVLENDTVDAYFERLCEHLGKTTEEQKRQYRAELETKQIHLEDLIRGNSDLIKNNARQLADALLEHWFKYVVLEDRRTVQRILGADGSSALAEMFQKLFKTLDIAGKIADKIRRYVNVHNKTDLPYEIIADISAELLNGCINTVCFEYLDESDINELRQGNEKNKLGLVLDSRADPMEESIEELFTKIDKWDDIVKSKPEEMRSLPSYRNYLAWYHRLKIGFVHSSGVSLNYDCAANERLGGIIKECETIGGY